MKDLSPNPESNANDIADVYARKDETPTLGELVVTAQFGIQDENLSTNHGNTLTFNSADTTTGYMKFFIAPFPLKVTGGYFSTFSWSSGDLAPSNTNYWSFKLAKTTAAGATNLMVTATSESSSANALGQGGINLTANKAYSWNSFVWADAASTFAAGDILGFSIDRTGSPASTPLGIVTVTCTYVPV